MITWVLFAIWILFNVVDIAVSRAAVQVGAIEVGFLYQIFGSWTGLTITKSVLAIAIGGLLVYKRKTKMLILLTSGILGICIWNSLVFIVR